MVPGGLVSDPLRVSAMVFTAALCAGSAIAADHAHPPVRPVSSDVFSGRWYEIARTPNAMQKDCQAPTSDFLGFSDGAFNVVETCHRGAPTGPVKVVRAKARIVNPNDNTRFRMSFMAGMIHQEYWIIDHASDNSWIIMGTPGGNYVWLFSRRPALPAASLAAAVARAGALGYSPSHLVYPSQA